jgi:hypothetical protein
MKIVICGGGTAGWLAALMLSKVQPKHKVVVIESSKIGIVGAGEGSTGYLTDIIQGNSWNYGCNEADFLKETNATVKLGIKHKDWKAVGQHYIGPIDGTNSNGLCDYMLLGAIASGGDIHTSSFNGYLIEKNSSSFTLDEHGKLQNTHNHAYHFDAHLVGKYFKKVCGPAVECIDAQISNIQLSEVGDVTGVVCDNGLTVDGDFFIDATGFARLFMKPLGNHWNSYRANLPVNTAMPFLLPYEDDEVIEPVTTAWAQSAGWMWQIPTQNRKGCGYVFDDNFISNEQAHAEIEKLLGRKVDPIRFLKFDTGRLEKAWVKNCLSIGLSAAFAEPLEATSIHSTIVQLQSFIFEYLRDTKEATCNQGSISVYNRKTGQMYDDFTDFLVAHYTGGRTDSEFWRWIATKETYTPLVSSIIEMQKDRHLRSTDLLGYYGYAGADLYNWVLAGLGHLTPELAKKELDFYSQGDLHKQMLMVHEYNMSKLAKDAIENTAFVRNTKEYVNGDRIPQ